MYSLRINREYLNDVTPSFVTPFNIKNDISKYVLNIKNTYNSVRWYNTTIKYHSGQRQKVAIETVGAVVLLRGIGLFLFSLSYNIATAHIYNVCGKISSLFTILLCF